MSSRSEKPVSNALLAARLLECGRHLIGGVLIRTRPCVELDRWLEALQATLQVDRAIEVPAHVTPDRLDRSLDLARTLRDGTPAWTPGILSEASGKLVVLRGIDRFPTETIARFARRLDEADPPIVVVIDERDDGQFPTDVTETGSCEALFDRLGIHLLHGDFASPSAEDCPENTQGDPDRHEHQVLSFEQAATDLCRLAASLGVLSGRAEIMAMHVARLNAQLRGAANITQCDLEVAARLVLLPRATQLPADVRQQEAEPQAPDARQSPDAADQSTEQATADTPDQSDDGDAGFDRLIDVARAALPDGLLDARNAAQRRLMNRSQQHAGAGAAWRRAERGRRIGTRTGTPRTASDLNLVATLVAAAPWQKLRERTRTHGLPSNDSHSPRRRMHLRPADFRLNRYKVNAETLVVFVVDASGSAAAARLGEAKGAVELLLAENYARRDQVALVTMRGRASEICLQPTRSLARAKRDLVAMHGGGGTPLASGIDCAFTLGQAAASRGQSPILVFLTDGQANVDRDGSGGRTNAERDAFAAARAVALSGMRSLVIDVGRRAQPKARALADAMDAQYLPLPFAGADGVSSAVRAVADSL